jgi:hypothetical protein
LEFVEYLKGLGELLSKPFVPQIRLLVGLLGRVVGELELADGLGLVATVQALS